MKVSLCQVASPDAESPAERLCRVDRMIREEHDADLIMLPELWGVGYGAFDRYQDAAERLSGPTIQAAARWARELGAYVHVGSIVERSADGRLYNTALLLDPTGAVAHTYRKVHLFGYHSLEAQLLGRGRDWNVAATSFAPFAATTCYDLRFPELWRCLADRGAELVCVPAAWPAARLEHWRIFTSARAIENQLLLLACNAVGTHHGMRFGGHSRVVTPWGEILLELGEDEEIGRVDVDLTVIAEVRREFPVLRDRSRDVIVSQLSDFDAATAHTAHIASASLG